MQGPESTVAYLKPRLGVASFPGITSKDPASEIPSSVKFDRGASETNSHKKELRPYLRKFQKWALDKKAQRAEELLADFKCSSIIESQALGLSLERNFPEADAILKSETLHEKVISCDDPHKQESLLRLAVFSIQKGQCEKALGLLQQFPQTAERGVKDRVAYMQGLCAQPVAVDSRNPWGGYGIHLAEVKIPVPEKNMWFLTTRSGSEEWDRLLASFVELIEKHENKKVQYIAGLLDYEKFRALPQSFQASMMVLMHYSGADLSVFQTLHRYLSENPHMITKEVAGLLFPVRYWKEILTHCKSADPILVKALIRQESAFNPTAKSPAKAYGLMQLIYPTAKLFGVKKRQDLFEPEVNIRAGSAFLGKLIQDFGSVELALAAYNAGPLLVREWQKRYPTENIDLFVEMIPYSETREYVRLVNRNYKIYQTLLLDKGDQKPDLAQNLK